MFGVKQNACVGFESQWKVKRVLCETAAQTEFSTKECAVTTSVSTESETQTDEKPPLPETADYDVQKLSEWLKRIYPLVKREIDDSNNSQAFKGYRPIGDDVEPVCKLLQKIEVPSFNKEESEYRRVTAISWNCTGQTLAVASNYSHTTWCYHGGIIGIFTLDSKGLLPELPTKTLVAESCITTICFHPNMRSIIAAGTFNGEAILFDISKDNCCNDVVCKAEVHDENVTDLSWVQDIDAPKVFLLATSSVDALLNMWHFDSSESELKIKHRYKIKSPVFSKTKLFSYDTDEVPECLQRGITCFDFSPHVPDLFVVCIEGGLVVRCSATGTRTLKESVDGVPVLDPVFEYYERHHGDILSVQFSPNRKDMFLTSASDGKIRIFLIEQAEPAQVIFVESNLNACCWVPYEEKLIAGGGAGGCLQLFHVTQAREIAGATEMEKMEDVIVMEMEINKKRSSLAAVGDHKGNLYLWNCPWRAFIENNL